MATQDVLTELANYAKGSNDEQFEKFVFEKSERLEAIIALYQECLEQQEIEVPNNGEDTGSYIFHPAQSTKSEEETDSEIGYYLPLAGSPNKSTSEEDTEETDSEIEYALPLAGSPNKSIAEEKTEEDKEKTEEDEEKTEEAVPFQIFGYVRMKVNQRITDEWTVKIYPPENMDELDPVCQIKAVMKSHKTEYNVEWENIETGKLKYYDTEVVIQNGRGTISLKDFQQCNQGIPKEGWNQIRLCISLPEEQFTTVDGVNFLD